jgi:hypothetical protein
MVIPADWAAAPAALATAIDRVDPDLAATQLVVVVGSAEAAVAVTQAIIAERGQTQPRVVAATGASRVGRVLRAGAAPVVVGTPEQILALLRMSVLKLDAVRAVAVAWIEDIEMAGRSEDLEAVLADVPKSAARIVITAKVDPAVEDFVERHARRATIVRPSKSPAAASPHIDTTAPSAAAAPVSYVLCPPSARALVLRTVLDELDPPSGMVYVRSDASAREAGDVLRALGYEGEQAAIRLTRGGITEHASTVVLYDLPRATTEWQEAVAGNPARIVALLPPRLLDHLRSLATAEPTPMAFTAPLDTARAREAQLRSELRRELSTGTPGRELLTLEPLLTEFDGVALAAAALHLLEQERKARARLESSRVASAPPAAQIAAPRGAERRGPPSPNRRSPAGPRHPPGTKPLPRNPR